MDSKSLLKTFRKGLKTIHIPPMQKISASVPKSTKIDTIKENGIAFSGKPTPKDKETMLIFGKTDTVSPPFCVCFS